MNKLECANNRVLVIDDNSSIHQDFAKILQKEQRPDDINELEAEIFGKASPAAPQSNFVLDSALQGQEGLEKVRQALAENRPYAMAFVDIRMPPGWDGIETTMKIWEIQPDLQIVICTAYSDYSWDEMTAKVGYSDQLVILKKPFDTIEVLQLANALTKKWSLLKQAQLKVEDMEQTIRSRTAELHNSHSEMETLLASISAAIIGLNADGQVVRWNRASEQLFGVSHDRIVNRPIREAGIQWDWAQTQRGINHCRQNRCAVELNDIEYRNNNGETGFVNLALTPSRQNSANGLDVILLATDVTQRRSIEAQLRQSQKLKVIGQLAAGIAHELNTPAQYVADNTHFLQDAFASYQNAIRACQELISKKDQLTPAILGQTAATLKASDLDYLSEQIPAAIGESLEGIQRVSQIVKAMKNFSHPGSHEISPANLNRAIESTVTVASNEWKYVAEMKLNLDESLPLVPCMISEFNQVILNLIVNAAHTIGDVVRDQHGKKGTIEITTRMVNGHAEVRIRDTGTGIPESAREKLFEPFFTTKEVGKGTGQGLFIAHSVIVEKHGGTIHFETEMGVGTTFVIRMPLAVSPQQHGTTEVMVHAA